MVEDALKKTVGAGAPAIQLTFVRAMLGIER